MFDNLFTKIDIFYIELPINWSYYFELIGSQQYNGLYLALNAIMYDTVLNDQVSSNVNTEKQTIEITSTIIKETFVLAYLYHSLKKELLLRFLFLIKSLEKQNVDIEDSISEVQFVSITSTGLTFAIVYDGVYSGKYRYY